MPLKTKIMLASLAIASQFIMFSAASFAQNWPQWRGPHRDGHLEDFSAPARWPDSLKKVWSIAAGAGLSSPVVAEDNVYLLTRDGEDEVVSCYRISSGERVWQQRYRTPFIPNPQAVITRFFPVSQGKGPFATPLVHNNRLYTLGIDRVLSCFDVKTGDLLWRHHDLKQTIPEKIVYACAPCGCAEDAKRFDAPGNCPACGMSLGPLGMETSEQVGIGNYYGAAASPLVANEQLIVNIGNPEAGYLIAFDLASGKESWRWQGPSPSSSSPVLAELHGVKQIIVLTRTNLAGVALENGQELWRYEIESNAQIVTPIFLEDLVIFSAYRSPTTAVRISKTGKAWSAQLAWSNNEVTLYTSTPVLVGDKLYGLSYANRGQFFAMEARTGKVLWTSEGRQAGGAAILHAGERMFALTNEAALIVLSTQEAEYKPLARYQVSDNPTWAHPLLWEKNILVKDETNLTLWRLE